MPMTTDKLAYIISKLGYAIRLGKEYGGGLVKIDADTAECILENLKEQYGRMVQDERL